MNAQDFLNDRAGHHIRFLFKSSLGLIEDLRKTHKIEFDKLKESIPDEYVSIVEQANYFDDDYYQIYRKKILDVGNSVLRDYNSELDTLTVEFKFKQ